VSRVLLVQPRFPLPSKSLNHKDYLPVGLLKLASWRRAIGDDVETSFGRLRDDWRPDEVYVTSLFTYWSGAVKEAVEHYRGLYGSRVHITVGGIYASLQPEDCRKRTGCDSVHEGVHEQAEMCPPDYSLVDADFQIVHASRGCVRTCRFCGTHTIEPEFTPKKSIRREIEKNHLVFYDNNLIANPHIESLLGEIAETRLNNRVITCESQSGIDGRILSERPHLASLLKSARFRNLRIAWDGPFDHAARIRDQIGILVDAGFSRKDIQVFMIYNHDLGQDTLMAKVRQCLEWGVQVSDCRYRPLDLYEDGYRPGVMSQDDGEYYIHEGWSDRAIRELRREVRANNICVRYGIPLERYDQRLESFKRSDREAMALDLGFTGRRHHGQELQAINERWLEQRVK
jgi:hypothetical protein